MITGREGDIAVLDAATTCMHLEANSLVHACGHPFVSLYQKGDFRRDWFRKEATTDINAMSVSCIVPIAFCSLVINLRMDMSAAIFIHKPVRDTASSPCR